MRATIFSAVAAISVLQFPSAQAAEFVAEQTWSYGLWSAHLYRNLNGNRLFCAIEAENGGTYFRVNRYKDSGEVFLEIYNPDWDYMEGNVRFSINFLVGAESYGADFAGKSWGNSFTHDFQKANSYDAVLGLLASATTFDVQNSNGISLAQFAGTGSREAVQAYNKCLGK